MAVVPQQSRNTGNGEEASILKVLAWFDIFQYPLLKSEIKKFLDQPVSDATLEKALQCLLDAENVFRINDFYSLHSDCLPAEKRIQGNFRAEKLLPKAIKIGRFLFRFPFVRAIGVSGSLSKYYADEKADIDFFVITKANRLWIARTIMHIFKKVTFITGHQHFYCMNYYLDRTSLQLEDKNIFTAFEIKTLLPVSGRDTMIDFFAANGWTDDFLPACNFRHQQKPEPGKSWLRRLVEWMFRNKTGDWLDNCLMKITSHRWEKKEENGKRNKKGLRMGLITGKHFAWSNPGSFQEKVLSHYNQKLSDLKSKMPKWFD